MPSPRQVTFTKTRHSALASYPYWSPTGARHVPVGARHCAARAVHWRRSEVVDQRHRRARHDIELADERHLHLLAAERAHFVAEGVLCRGFFMVSCIVPSSPRWVSQETVQRTRDSLIEG